MVIIQCDQCATKYTVPDEKVPASGIKAQCKGCGHIMLVSRPVPEETIEEPLESASYAEETWSCVCGASNEPDAGECGTCGQPKTGLMEVSEEPYDSEDRKLETGRGQARSGPLVPWRSLMLVGALAVVVGVGASYLLGLVLNRSLASFLSAIFK